MKKLRGMALFIFTMLVATACLFAFFGCAENDSPTLPTKPPINDATPPDDPILPGDPVLPEDPIPQPPPAYTLEEIRAHNATFSKGDLVAFGSYPYSVVIDSSLIKSLAAIAADERGIVEFEGKRYLKYVANAFNGLFLNGDRIVGDTYYFEYKDIVWEVVKKNAGILTLSSTAVLEVRPFDENEINVFSQSTLCEFLNGEWCNDIFSESERTWLISQNVDNPTLSGEPKPDGVHKVYLPSASEWNAEGWNREKVYTDLVRAKGLLGDGEYWLRDGGRADNLAGIVEQQGANPEGRIVSNLRGVSPVVNIDVQRTTKILESAFRVHVDNRYAPGGTVYGGGTGTKACPPILTAVPFNGFELTGWTKNGESFAAERLLYANAEGTYTAVFVGENENIKIIENEEYEVYLAMDVPLKFECTANYSSLHYFSVGKGTGNLPFSVILYQEEVKILTVEYDRVEEKYVFTDHTNGDTKTTVNMQYPRIPFDATGGLTYTFTVMSNSQLQQCPILLERDKAIQSKIVQYDKTQTEYYIGEQFQGVTFECTYDDGTKGDILVSDFKLDTSTQGNKYATIDGTWFEYAVFPVTNVWQTAVPSCYVNTVFTLPEQEVEIVVNGKTRAIDMMWEMITDIDNANFENVGENTLSATTGGHGWTFKYSVKSLPTGDFEQDEKIYRYAGYYPQRETDEFVRKFLDTLTPDTDGTVTWKGVRFYKLVITNLYQSKDLDKSVFELYTQYKIGDVKYFMYEPTLWRKVKTPNGEGYLSDKILHAKQFDEKTTDYAKSSIKTFVENELGKLFTHFECEVRFELPQKSVMVDEDNGFFSNEIINDKNRIAKPTDFARGMGLYFVSIPLIIDQVTTDQEEINSFLQFLGNANYWTQGSEDKKTAYVVHATGDIVDMGVDTEYVGIRPVMYLS